MRRTVKLATYSLLLAGAAMFILPFAWMVLTALKPLNQTLQQSRLWLPRRYEAELAGVVQEVWPGALVTEPSVWVLEQGAAQPVLLPESSLRGDTWQPLTGSPLPVVVLRRIPATPGGAVEGDQRSARRQPRRGSG